VAQACPAIHHRPGRPDAGADGVSAPRRRLRLGDQGHGAGLHAAGGAGAVPAAGHAAWWGNEDGGVELQYEADDT